MRPQHTAPQPIRLRLPSDDLRTTVVRGVGAKITCPTCGQSRRSRSWTELRGWLRWHDGEEHGT